MTAAVPEGPNTHIFRFLRDRADFVRHHAGVEAFVVWGAATDSLCTIHARRLQRSLEKTGQCFVQGMIDLGVGVGVSLETVSVPLLAHELQQVQNAGELDVSPLLSSSCFVRTQAASKGSRIWTVSEDVDAAQEVTSLKGGVPAKVARLFDRCRYADLLYRDYRCAYVHALDLGHRAWSGDGMRDDQLPQYMNHHVDGDPRPEKHRLRVRLSFSRGLLAQILCGMIEREEAACARDGWTIPPYASHSDV